MPKGIYQRRRRASSYSQPYRVMELLLFRYLPLDTHRWTAAERERWMTAMIAAVDLLVDVIEEPKAEAER